jgi:maleylpyruvate isomerase
MAPPLVQAREWMQQGTLLFTERPGLDDRALAEPSALPGWSRKHVLAHLAANADALGNLIRWAATGQPSPMYASPAEREAGIEQGSRLPAGELAEWLRRSAAELEGAMMRLTELQWQAPVVTAQGRTVPAVEVPWMRSREVWVHAVDLAAGTSFADLPGGFVAALCDDVIRKRSAADAAVARAAIALTATDTGRCWELPGEGDPLRVAGPQADICAYLTGRAHGLTVAGGGALPALPAWL